MPRCGVPAPLHSPPVLASGETQVFETTRLTARLPHGHISCSAYARKEGARVDRRVLIIDDDPSMLEVLRAELERRSYGVVTETSPQAALRDLTDQDFGVVLSDLTMRGMSGVDLCRKVVLLREDTPVIVITAFASIESAIASIRAGAYDF